MIIDMEKKWKNTGKTLEKKVNDNRRPICTNTNLTIISLNANVIRATHLIGLNRSFQTQAL